MHSHDRTLLASLGFADPDKKDARHDLACQYLALPDNHERLARMVAPSTRGGNRLISIRDSLNESSKSGWLDCEWSVDRHEEIFTVASPTLECVISKGEGKYKTTVGFLDVVLPFSWKRMEHGRLHGWLKRHVETVLDTSNPWNGCPGYQLEDGASREYLVRRDSLPEGLRAAFPYQGRQLLVRRAGGTYTASVPQLARGWFETDRECEGHGVVPVEVKIARASIGDVLRQIALYREHAFTSETWILATPYALDKTDIATLRNARTTHIRLGEKFDAWVAARAEETAEPGEESPEI